MTPTATPRETPDFLTSGSEMSGLMRAMDWSTTPLGPAESWPQSLRTTVSVCLNSRFPMLLWWGPDLIMLYNDAYRPILGATKHPRALGAAGRDIWPEIWDIIGPMLHGVIERGEATWSDDLLLVLDRNGYPEECYLTFSYSPIRDESGGVGGVFTAVHETTGRVIGERRLRTLRELAAETAQVTTEKDVYAIALDALARNLVDLPFALLYVLDPDGTTAHLAGATGLPADSPANPAVLSLALADEAASAWPLRAAALSSEPCLMADLNRRFGGMPQGAWPDAPPTQAVVLPLGSPGPERPAAFLVAGLNPRRAFDDDYRGFCELVARHVATAIANARASEAERERAETNAQFRVHLDRALAQMAGADEIASAALALLGQRLDVASCALLEIDRETDQPDVEYAWTTTAGGPSAAYDPAAFFLPSFRPALEASHIIAVDDVPRNEGATAVADEARAFAIAPYVVGGELAAMLHVAAVTPRHWRADELQLLGEVLARVWPAVERARAVAALSREQELLQTIIDRIPVMITMYDPEAQLLWLNSEFERIVGWSSREAAGVSLMEECYPDPALRASVDHHMQSGRGEWLDVQMRTRDGRTIDTSWATVHLSDQTQVSIGIDITARQQMEEALRAGEERFRRTFENAAVGIAHVGLDGSWLRMNDKLCEITGYTRDELQHLTFQDITYPDDLDADLEYVRQLLAGERQTYSMEKRYIRKDGSPVWVNLTGSLLRTPTGAPDHFIAVVQDVTRRKAAEATAQQQARLIELSQEPIFVWELGGGIVEWNAGAERLYGFSAEEAIGRVSHDLLHTAHPLPLGELQSLLKNGEPWAGELRHTTKDGREVIVASRQQLIKVDGRRLVLETNRDITEQKRAEAALREADRRKDEFLATLAHELRNPLAPVRNAVQILKRQDSLDPSSEAARDMIERQVQHMVRLLDDLLDMSRITQDKLELRTEVMELAPILAQALETARPHVEGDTHEIMVSVPEAPICLDADPVRLVQVFSNLLNNASKYTQPGGRIWLTAERAGDDVVVSVKDTGAGIPPDKLDSVFDLFTQLDRPAEQSRSGLGLGLTLVKRLVEMHGGSVAAYSDGPGRGSEFVVRLPVLADPPQAEAAPTSAGVANGKSRRVLVVDDNYDIAESLTELLELEGHEARMAHDGLEALALAQEFRPDVVLLDIDLPRLDGYEAARRIREQPWGRQMALVALTGWGQAEARRKSQEVGFDYHLVKPVDIADLMRLLATLPAQESYRPRP